MNTIALRPWELAAYMREKKLLVVRPVKGCVVRPSPGIRIALSGPDTDDVRYDAEDDLWFCEGGIWSRKCPFGKPGEVLGIKEAFRTGEALDRLNFAEIASSCLSAGYTGPWCPLKYEADGATKEKSELVSFGGEWGKLRLANHMPPWAIRHRPTIADIRVMRVQDIEGWDVVAAGIDDPEWHKSYDNSDGDFLDESAPIEEYREQWEEDHGNGSWADNPWCWFMNVVE